jgi:hypothetical protein
MVLVLHTDVVRATDYGQMFCKILRKVQIRTLKINPNQTNY